MPVLMLAAGCGAPVSTSSGAAACIVASACGLFGIPANSISTSACTDLISGVNDPSLGLLFNIGSPVGGGVIHVSPSQVNCIAGSGTDCNKAKACLNNGMTPPACSGNSDTCMGNIITSCSAATGSGGNNGQSVFDCSALGVGYTCVASNGQVDCGTASCGGGNPTQCQVNVLQECRNGILRQVDCTRFSATCVTTVGAHCRGSGPGCSQMVSQDNPFASVRCDGSVLVTCTDGQEARYDCSRQGLSCTTNFGKASFGCNAGSECDPNTYTSICTNNTLTFCNKGKIDTFNCGGAGFTGCNAQAGTCTKG